MSAPTTMTLLDLRNAVRGESDIVNSTQFFTDTLLNSWINSSAFELYDILIQRYADHYFVAAPFRIVTDGTNDHYNLPADFYKGIGLDLYLSNSADSKVTLEQFQYADRNKYSVPNFQTFYGVTNLRYLYLESQVWLTPLPAGNQNIDLLYIPRMSQLVADGDTFDGISGWLEYVIVDVCIKVCGKEESDSADFKDRKAKLMKRIENAAENRNAGSPPKVSDTLFNNIPWPNGNGNGFGTPL